MANRFQRGGELNVISLVKSKTQERYVWIYDDDHSQETIQSIGRAAANESLSFSWYDAAVLAKRIRERRWRD